MSKICPNCETENPSAFKFCGKCGFQLVEEEQLSEADKLRKQLAEQKKQNELLERNKELEKERLEKELQETKKRQEKAVRQPEIQTVQSVSKPSVPSKPRSKSKITLTIVLALIALLVFGGFLFVAVIQPALIDKNAARYYTFVNSTILRSSKEAGGDYNKICSVPYGGELITYEYTANDWSSVKYDGKKGFISSAFVIDRKDFTILNSIFGDTESKDCIPTAKCRIALLNYFKEKGYIGNVSPAVLSEVLPTFITNNGNQWQVLCKDVKIKPNNIFYQKLYNKNSKFTDFAVIIKNINTGERRLLIFYFDDDETPHQYYEEPVYSQGYIKNIATKYDIGTGGFVVVTQYTE
jgi:hypothetical protein